MDWWLLGLIALCVIGVAVIGFGALRDRHKHRHAVREMLNPPARDIPQLPADADTPTYLTRAQARRPVTQPASAPTQSDAETEKSATGETPPDESGEEHTPQPVEQHPVTIAVGYASDDFITDSASNTAILEKPRVLASAEPIMAIRELIGPLERMIVDDAAIVIAAPSMAPDVLETLAVNQIQRHLRVLVILTKDPTPVDTICSASGARLIGRVDLQSGYVTDDDLGHCERWVADRNTSTLSPVHPGNPDASQP